MRCGTLLKVKNLNVTKRGVIQSQSISIASKGNKELPFSTFISSNAIKGKKQFSLISSFVQQNSIRVNQVFQMTVEQKQWFSNTPVR